MLSHRDLFDGDAVRAAADLVQRTGARRLEIGYLHDNVPVEHAGWYAQAQYRGARITESDHPGPAEAAEALARRLLQGGQCQHCHRTVALSDQAPAAYVDGHLMEGRRWTADQARAAGTCWWRRIGDRWERGCDGPIPPPAPRVQKKPKRKRGPRRGS
ncbi:hypothetical protein ACBI99_44820 [Nonomuraea sp. ATR24]|uniref:hypothetical protein n=1 Tax=Nonomuraea sp. ATR24 TaxID=1676744 RepID=UPI0035C1D8F7